MDIAGEHHVRGTYSAGSMIEWPRMRMVTHSSKVGPPPARASRIDAIGSARIAAARARRTAAASDGSSSNAVSVR